MRGYSGALPADKLYSPIVFCGSVARLRQWHESGSIKWLIAGSRLGGNFRRSDPPMVTPRPRNPFALQHLVAHGANAFAETDAGEPCVPFGSLAIGPVVSDATRVQRMRSRRRAAPVRIVR